MKKFIATWLRTLREEADLKLEVFLLELNQESGITYNERKLGGWERIDRGEEYRNLDINFANKYT